MGSTALPQGMLPAARRVRDDANELAGLLRQMATIADPSQYTASAQKLQTIGARFDNDYRDLVFAPNG